MSPEDAFAIFDSLNDKQHETLMLAARHLTSKQIAQQLGLAPVTIDKRIEGVRSRLDGLPRTDLLRLYKEWGDTYDRTINGSIILEPTPSEVPDPWERPSDPALTFGDNLVLDARAPWERQSVWLRPGMKPSDLGVGGKLLAMLLGAVAIMAVAVLCMAFVEALTSMLER
jgi:DNA-binding CsgD family transcriptional regulator